MYCYNAWTGDSKMSSSFIDCTRKQRRKRRRKWHTWWPREAKLANGPSDPPGSRAHTNRSTNVWRKMTRGAKPPKEGKEDARRTSRRLDYLKLYGYSKAICYGCVLVLIPTKYKQLVNSYTITDWALNKSRIQLALTSSRNSIKWKVHIDLQLLT